MKQREYVIRFCPVPCYQLGAVGEYLEKMAAKGLIFVGKRGIKFRFHREAPQKLHFCATVFDKASQWDTRAESDTLDYLEYCGAEGWEYICTDGKVQYFRSAQDEPVPIETDPAAELKQIHRAFRKKTVLYPLLWTVIDLLIFFIPLFAILIDPWDMPIGTYCYTAAFCFGAVVSLTDLIGYLAFYFSNRRNIKAGEGIRYNRCGSCVLVTVIPWFILVCGLLVMGVIFRMIWLLCGLAVCLSVIVIIQLTNGVIDGNRREARTREENKFLSFMKGLTLFLTAACYVPVIFLLVMLFPNDKVPFTLEDAGITVPAESYRNVSAQTTRYLSYTENYYYDGYMHYADKALLIFDDDLDDISYTLYSFRDEDTLQRWLTMKTEEDPGWDLTEVPEAAAAWGARSAYYIEGYSYDGEYILAEEYLFLYDDTALTISENLLQCPELYDTLTQ